MADPNELFWPSLYSRLAPSRYSDDEHYGDDIGDTEEGVGMSRFFADFDTLREHIEVELEAMLNASCLEAALLGSELRGLPADTVKRGEYPFDAYPRVQRSILNYGMPAIIGRNAYTLPIKLIEERLRRAITDFEPRVRPDSVNVKLVAEDSGAVSAERPLEFVISGEILGADGAMRVVINSVWDPEKIRSHVAVGR